MMDSLCLPWVYKRRWVYRSHTFAIPAGSMSESSLSSHSLFSGPSTGEVLTVWVVK